MLYKLTCYLLTHFIDSLSTEKWRTWVAYCWTNSTMTLVKSRHVGTVWQYGTVLSISCLTGDSVTCHLLIGWASKHQLPACPSRRSSAPLHTSSSWPWLSQPFTTHDGPWPPLFSSVTDISNIPSSSSSTPSRRTSNASAGNCQSSYHHRQSWASQCPDVKNYKRQFNPVRHRMIYSCIHTATVGVKELMDIFVSIKVNHTGYDTVFISACISSLRSTPWLCVRLIKMQADRKSREIRCRGAYKFWKIKFTQFLRGYRDGSPTTDQALRPCPLWEPFPSHPILV